MFWTWNKSEHLKSGRGSGELHNQNVIIKNFQISKQEILLNQLILMNKAKYSEIPENKGS